MRIVAGDYVTLTGNVGQNPERRTVNAKGEDAEIVEFSLAVREGATRESGTRWFDVTIWNAERADWVEDHLYKGAKAAVEGKVTTREYEGRTYYKVNASFVGLVEWGGQRTTQGQRPPAREAAAQEDEFPF